ncbi:9853_t:CDS:2, partial [Cetraspora pellucida]
MLLENMLTTRFRQHKNHQWTAREKLFVITYLERAPGATVCGTADLFKIELKQIREWCNKRVQRNELKPVSRSMMQVKAAALAKSQQYTLQYPNI